MQGVDMDWTGVAADCCERGDELAGSLK